ncbi:MAG: transglutaminase family protein [Croceitalea sp.]|nr:transglutaminase family protein [Croceitalea sp.]NNL08422.1 transglutaminase family protein [Croceitalea sp.]NNM18252.1 transglutaminase family protein [Croceitalea sp.]
MLEEYSIVYKAENSYENAVAEAYLQFLIIPEENDSQELLRWDFANSLNAITEVSSNGYGFKVIRVRPNKPFNKITFEAKFKVLKKNINPFDFVLNFNIADDYILLDDLDFKVENERYLKATHFTILPNEHRKIFSFDRSISVFENLRALNHWVYIHLYFKTGVTNVDTTLGEVIENRHGVCQDFSHLFCAIARENNVPARYISGYLHQGNGYFGDMQMHAWTEAFVPNVGWVGFDPTNDLLVSHNHIKVAHGKDYDDCSPLKGVVYAHGRNETQYSVEVHASQQ